MSDPITLAELVAEYRTTASALRRLQGRSVARSRNYTATANAISRHRATQAIQVQEVVKSGPGGQALAGHLVDEEGLLTRLAEAKKIGQERPELRTRLTHVRRDIKAALRSDQADQPSVVEAAAKAGHSTPQDSVRPCSKTVRAALKAAGLARAVERVTTGKKACHVSLVWQASYVDREAQAEKVLAALRPLWDDADDRVYSISPSSVTILVAGYYRTHPVQAQEAEAAEVSAEELNELKMCARGLRYTGLAMTHPVLAALIERGLVSSKAGIYRPTEAGQHVLRADQAEREQKEAFEAATAQAAARKQADEEAQRKHEREAAHEQFIAETVELTEKLGVEVGMRKNTGMFARTDEVILDVRTLRALLEKLAAAQGQS